MTKRSKKVALRVSSILRQRGSSLADQIEQVEDLRALDRQTREDIVDELTDELSAKGLSFDSEPNKYGLEIESLIDHCALALDETEGQIN